MKLERWFFFVLGLVGALAITVASYQMMLMEAEGRVYRAEAQARQATAGLCQVRDSSGKTIEVLYSLSTFKVTPKDGWKVIEYIDLKRERAYYYADPEDTLSIAYPLPAKLCPECGLERK